MSLEHRIYLASRSPRRRELLAQIGLGFDMLLFRLPPREDPEVDETWHGQEAAADYVQRVAQAKARHGANLLVTRSLPLRPVLAADTTIDFDGEVIGKPADEADAMAILARLSGRSHRVLTAIAVARRDKDAEQLECVLSASEVRFRDLASDEIRRYVQSGEPMDKAGAYGIQGRAAMFVAEIHGSHSGIVGLPLCDTVLLLRKFGCPI
jgi:septum formation protein